MDLHALECKRLEILEAMSRIRCMRPGSLSEQYLKVRIKGRKEPVLRGPYFLWQYYEGNKPVRKRLTSPEQVGQARQEIANHKRFLELCRQFEDLTRQLGQAEREQDASQEAVKKGLKSRPRRAPK